MGVQRINKQTRIQLKNNIDDPNVTKLYELIAKNNINPKTNSALTQHQIKVFELCAQIPEGYISTYGAIAKALKSSPRAVGQALKLNPFAPSPVPCHRVVASSGFIGGFSGQWGKGEKIDEKKRLLLQEGLLKKKSSLDENEEENSVQEEFKNESIISKETFQNKMFVEFKV